MRKKERVYARRKSDFVFRQNKSINILKTEEMFTQLAYRIQFFAARKQQIHTHRSLETRILSVFCKEVILPFWELPPVVFCKMFQVVMGKKCVK
jgi:hypothetical protein